jgi:hypothetical protein
MECRLNKKIIDVETDLEVKTGDKYRPWWRGIKK